jgi:hypothetical protein
MKKEGYVLVSYLYNIIVVVVLVLFNIKVRVI